MRDGEREREKIETTNDFFDFLKIFRDFETDDQNFAYRHNRPRPTYTYIDTQALVITHNQEEETDI